MIQFNFETNFKLKPQKQYKNWIKEIIYRENLKCSEIAYIFCADACLLEINRQYLKHNTYTDIITFDYTEGQDISGDIYISIERVRENAIKYKVPFEEELLRVMSHGIYHLCGYKDKLKEDVIMMRKKEENAILLFKQLQSDFVNNKNTNCL